MGIEADAGAGGRGLIYVVERYAHHSASSGYDHLPAVFPGAACLSQRECLAGDLVWLRPPADVARPPRSLTELAACAGREAIWHVLQGDSSAFPLLLRQAAPRAKIVITVHQLPPVLLALGRLDVLDAADCVVTLSRDHARAMRDLGLRCAVVAAPYGIWNAPFQAGDPPARDGGVLVVGEHLRDWKFLHRAIVELAAMHGVACRLVIPPYLHARFSGIPGVIVEANLSEPELIERYRRAAVLLLPLTASTANTTVLEAMASGCPVVCNRLPAVEEYLGDAASYFDTDDLEGCLTRVVELIWSPRARRERSEALVERSGQYDWRRVAPVYAALYDHVRAEIETALA